MARRNKRRRKRKTDGFTFPVPFAGAVIVVSVLALVYVWLGCRCESLGREIKRMESRRMELGKRYLNEEYRWTRLKSPRSLEQALERLAIPMHWPDSSQVVTVGQPDVGRGSLAVADFWRERSEG